MKRRVSGPLAHQQRFFDHLIPDLVAIVLDTGELKWN
jgi:hypothetical protein